MVSRLAIRPVCSGDAVAIAAIYDHHVRHGTASFDERGPDASETCAKIKHITERGWPFLVAELEHTLVGYAYATQFRDRAAYSYTCENSIYVHPDHLGQGLGRQLLAALLADAERANFRQMIAVIGGGEPASVALHRAAGFVEAGRLRSVGFKFDRWLDSVYMQKSIGKDGLVGGDGLEPPTLSV